MTNATIERIASLMHAEALAAIASRPDIRKHFRGQKVDSWEKLEEWNRELYRAVARKVLKALGR